MTSYPAIADDTNYFNSVPWCASLLSEPDIVLFTPTSRLPDENIATATRDQLFRKTLKHGDAVPYSIGFYRNSAVAGHGSTSTSTTTTTTTTTTTKPETTQDGLTLHINQSSLLFALAPGVNGYNGSAHGGLISSLVDESMGSLIHVNHAVKTRLESQGQSLLSRGTLDLSNMRLFTASMAVRFKKPIPTPIVVIVTTSLSKIEGRKIFFDVRVKGGDGEEFAQCDGLWLSLPLEKV